MRLDGRLYSALSLLADVVVVNALLILTSLPLVTAGSASRAAAAVLGSMIEGEGSSRSKQFFREFARGWRPVTAWWFISTAVLLFAVYELSVILRAGLAATLTFAFSAAVLSGVIVISAVSVWFYPLHAQNPQPLRETFASAVLSAIRFLPRTLGALAVAAAVPLLLFYMPGIWPAVLFFMLICGWAALYYVMLLILNVERG